MSLSGKTIRYAAWAALNIVVARQVDLIVREPYMDEPFHIPQAQAYCRGEWSHWDPKITTPPGLYLVSIALMKVFLLPCTIPILRLTNVLLLTLLPPFLDRVIASVRVDQERLRNRSWLEPSAEAIIISSFPVFWFFAFLYYTDVASAISVLITLYVARSGWHKSAVVVGLLSCLFRQTNVIWLAFAFGSTSLYALHYPPEREAWDAERRKPQHLRGRQLTYFVFDHDVLAAKADFLDWIISVLTVIAERKTVLPLLPPYIAGFLAFLGFVVWNGGIVLGDKSNHVPVIHIPQVYYGVAFATAFGWPILFTGRHGVFRLLKNIYLRSFWTKWYTSRTIFIMAFILFTTWKYTIHHPFLLSDNRHYTFYIWKRLYMFHPAVPYLLAPVYYFCGYAWYVRLGQDNSLLNVCLFCGLTMVALIPTPLLEPRYFIVPYLILRILIPTTKKALMMEAAWYALINWGTMAVFLYKERWGVDGVIRFMW
ncbi:glucosyltransferase [Tulasnella sp. 427]|nr:glucosyltransferase [Tulasnella sp. 427]